MILSHQRFVPFYVRDKHDALICINLAKVENIKFYNSSIDYNLEGFTKKASIEINSSDRVKIQDRFMALCSKVIDGY